ncbi:helix-turn-helix domain-containing protein [bacterium]|nr:helix-turn-helix domain-containing protein [bacterium]
MSRSGATRTLSPVVEYFLDVFEGVCRSTGPITVSELARQINISKSTAHRILGLMKTRGFVVQQPGGPYRPGPKMITLGVAALKTSFSREMIDPIMDELSSQASETVLFGVWLAGSKGFLVIFERPTGHLLRFHPFLGSYIRSDILGGEAIDNLKSQDGNALQVHTNVAADGIWSVITIIPRPHKEAPCALMILAPKDRVDEEKMSVWKELCLSQGIFLASVLEGKS